MFTQASANDLANYIIHGNHTSTSTTTYLALSTTDPSSSVTEPSDSGYKRVALLDAFGSGTITATLVTDTTNGNYYQISNSSEINFPHIQSESGVSGIGYWAIYNAQTGASSSTLLAYGAFSSSIDLAQNDVFTIEAGSLIITFK